MTTIYISNLATGTSEEDLREFLEEIGGVKSLRLVGSNGPVVCEYFDPAAAKVARTQLDGFELHETPIEVRYTYELTASQRQPGTTGSVADEGLSDLGTVAGGKLDGKENFKTEAAAKHIMGHLPGVPTHLKGSSALDSAFGSLTQEQLEEIMYASKDAVMIDARSVKEALVGNPALTRALFAAQLKLDLVKVPSDRGEEVETLMQQLLSMLKPKPKKDGGRDKGQGGVGGQSRPTAPATSAPSPNPLPQPPVISRHPTPPPRPQLAQTRRNFVKPHSLMAPSSAPGSHPQSHIIPPGPGPVRQMDRPTPAPAFQPPNQFQSVMPTSQTHGSSAFGGNPGLGQFQQAQIHGQGFQLAPQGQGQGMIMQNVPGVVGDGRMGGVEQRGMGMMQGRLGGGGVPSVPMQGWQMQDGQGPLMQQPQNLGLQPTSQFLPNPPMYGMNVQQGMQQPGQLPGQVWRGSQGVDGLGFNMIPQAQAQPHQIVLPGPQGNLGQPQQIVLANQPGNIGLGHQLMLPGQPQPQLPQQLVLPVPQGGVGMAAGQIPGQGQVMYPGMGEVPQVPPGGNVQLKGVWDMPNDPAGQGQGQGQGAGDPHQMGRGGKGSVWFR